MNTQNWLNSVLSLQDIQELENVVSEKEPSSSSSLASSSHASSSHASVAAAVPLSEINQERPTTIANSYVFMFKSGLMEIECLLDKLFQGLKSCGFIQKISRVYTLPIDTKVISGNYYTKC